MFMCVQCVHHTSLPHYCLALLFNWNTIVLLLRPYHHRHLKHNHRFQHLPLQLSMFTLCLLSLKFNCSSLTATEFHFTCPLCFLLLPSSITILIYRCSRVPIIHLKSSRECVTHQTQTDTAQSEIDVYIMKWYQWNVHHMLWHEDQVMTKNNKYLCIFNY